MSNVRSSGTLRYTTASGRVVTLPTHDTLLVRPTSYGDYAQAGRPCPVCSGDGEVTTPERLIEPCWHCEGSGTEPVDA